METPNPISVQDKVILVTGATGLIGKEVCFNLLKNKAKVVLADINNSEFEEIAFELKNISNVKNFLLLKLDITDINSINHCIESIISKFGHIDVLINNAAIDAKFDFLGISKLNTSRFENYPIDLLKKSIDVNVIGTIQITQAVCRQMLIQGYGNIINVASTYSLVAPNQSLYEFDNAKDIKYKPIDYIATKSFIPNYTRYIATFYAKEGLRCNAIVPHGIFNNHDEAFQKNFAKLSPLGRMCDRSELNGLFMLLCSDASSYITGSIMVADGGWTAW
jgi:NAD(P)-dependent dehydrogenase (short-subunit alcohol dehydrogenase family)